MQKKLQASVLVYTLFLIMISLVFAVVVFNIAGVVINNNEYQNITRKLTSDIIYKGDLAVKYLNKLNSNGGGFFDNISCPTAVTLSGSLVTATIPTTLISTPFPRCTGTYSSQPLLLYFNSSFSAFTGAQLGGNYINVLGGVGVTPFADVDTTRINFSTGGLAGIDKIDDNYNSDDYRVISTGALAGTPYYYQGIYQDDDANARKIAYFYIPPGIGYWNIFWSNTQMKATISVNTNNNDKYNSKLATVSSGALYLNADKPYSIKILSFDKTAYDSYDELNATSEVTLAGQGAGLGYIQTDGSLAPTTTASYNFDFITKDYGIFLSNSSTGTLLFQLSGINKTTGSGVYLVPIDDSGGILRYMGGDIIIDSEGKYVHNQFEYIGVKNTTASTGATVSSCPYGSWYFGYCSF